MDAYLAIASRREVRDYAQRPIPAEVQRRILEAGRVAGSSRNRQPWRFVATDDRERLDALAGTVFAPANLRACALAIAVAATALWLDCLGASRRTPWPSTAVQTPRYRGALDQGCAPSQGRLRLLDDVQS